MIEEKFETDGEVVNNGFGLTCSRKVYREPYEYEWFIKLLFPANTKHPVFMCTLLGHKDALKTHFECGECRKADRVSLIFTFCSFL